MKTIQDIVSPAQVAQRKAGWSFFFAKFESYENDCQTSDALVTYGCKEVYKFYTEPKTDTGMMHLIEVTHQSNFRDLMLMREKAKLFLDKTSFDVAHTRVTKELRRLLDLVSRNGIDSYVKTIFTVKSDVFHSVENELSHLRDYLFFMCRHQNNMDEFKLWKKLAIQEWEYVRQFVTEENLVAYASSQLKQQLENNQAVQKNPAPHIYLVHRIEVGHRSNLRHLMLRMEKAKLLLEPTMYNAVRLDVVKEMERLFELLTKEIVASFVDIIFTVDSAVIQFIEKELQSPLKDYLFSMHKYWAKRGKFNLWKELAIKEWDYVRKFVSDEQLIVYGRAQLEHKSDHKKAIQIL